MLVPHTAGDKPYPCGANCSRRWTDTKHTIPLHEGKNKEGCICVFGHYKKFLIIT